MSSTIFKGCAQPRRHDRQCSFSAKVANPLSAGGKRGEGWTVEVYLAVLIAHRETVALVATDVAVLNHPAIGPRLCAQNLQLHSLLAVPNTSVAARLRAGAALGPIRRPLIAEPQIDLSNPPHQHIPIDAAFATLQPSRPSLTRNPSQLPTSVRTPSKPSR
jgi:hypothetical protein